MREEHPHATLVRRLYAGFGDPAVVRECFAEQAVWHIPGHSRIAGSYRGWEAIEREFFGKLRSLTRGTFKAALVDVLANDLRAVALQHATGQRGARRLEIDVCQVFRFQDGKIVEARAHYADQEHLDWFWS